MESKNYLKTIPFSEFDLWDVKRYNYAFDSDFKNAIFLKDILKQEKIAISKETLLEKNWSIISKINFQGELFLRNNTEIKNYKGKVTIVNPESIIYSKINVRHGCVYYHKTGSKPFAVSSEYPTFSFDKNRINGEYLKQVLRSFKFKELLNTKTSGISKARVKVDEFLNIKIPLPSIDEQNKIIKTYNEKIALADKQEQKAKELEQEIEDYLFDALGIEKLEEKKKNILRIINYANLNRWDNNSTFDLRSKYKIIKVSDIITEVSTGTTPPTNRKEYFEDGKINFYTPADLTDKMYLNFSLRKITKLALEANKARSFIKGTLLFVGIGSTVGKVGIIQDDLATSNQQITGIRINENKMNLEFVYYYFNHFKQITTAEKTQATIPIVNQNKILNIPIPKPPLDIQNHIAKHISELKEKIKTLKEESRHNREQAILDFEKEIFN